jgi:hypothetical protein
MPEPQVPAAPVSARTAESLEPSWSHLLASCLEALGLSRQIHEALVQGAAAAALIPLLRREAELAGTIQGGISDLGAQERMLTAPPEHAELVLQMAALAAMEEDNRRLFASRGVRLSHHGAPRSIPRSRPRPR